MTRRPGFVLAAALVLAVNAIALWKARDNRAAGPLAAIELTERELRLDRVQRDSTAMVLHLNWRPFRWPPPPEGEFVWFNQAKLEELGFDCRLAPGAAEAEDHYRRMPSRPAFVVLQYQPERDSPSDPMASRLEAVDAGTAYHTLRARYRDASRHLIVPGHVRLERNPRPQPALRGRINRLEIEEIYVPPPHNRLLAALPTDRQSVDFPRFAVVIAYGRNYEPWVVSVRKLDPPKPH